MSRTITTRNTFWAIGVDAVGRTMEFTRAGCTSFYADACIFDMTILLTFNATNGLPNVFVDANEMVGDADTFF